MVYSFGRADPMCILTHVTGMDASSNLVMSTREGKLFKSHRVLVVEQNENQLLTLHMAFS